MCGILGIVSLANAGAFNEGSFAVALDTLAHRGPDAGETRRYGDRAILGHRRLSIIDLSRENDQPLEYADGRYSLVFNGEIYNYLELREELSNLGASFRTEGDSEVILAAYAQWGEACVNRFNGMWAFALLDNADGSVFASRDRFGVKPFNYAEYDGQLVFASEIKAIVSYFPALIEPDHEVISNFVRTSVGAQSERTWFQRVRRLPPGCNMSIKGDKIAITRFWDYPEASATPASFEEAKAEFARLFEDAVRIRMRSDVPLGLTLSSGLDSSSIACQMHAIEDRRYFAYTARFRAEDDLVLDNKIYTAGGEAIDESVSAVRLSEVANLESRVVDTDYSDFVRRVTGIVWHLDSGNSSPAVLPLMQLLEEAKKELKVILEGQGADELMGGYIMAVFWASVGDLMRKGQFGEARRAMSEFSRTFTLSFSLVMMVRLMANRFPVISRFYERRSGVDAALGPKLRGAAHIKDYPPYAERKEAGFLRSSLRRQHAGGLVNLLHYGDAVSMAHSLESRMPFLDYRLVEFVWALPSEYKVRLGQGKHVHREAMRGLVPDWVLDNRTKLGFTTPIGRQFVKDFDDEGPVDVLLSERSLSRGLFDPDGLRALIADHRTGRRDHGPVLFRMLSVELWYRIFVDNGGAKP